MRSLRAPTDRKSFCLLGLWLAVGWCSVSTATAGGIRINEVMARNTSVEIPDEQGTPIVQDWIEVYNAGNSEVALARYSLTDDRDNHDKFRFPVGSRLGPGEFAIVYVVDPDDCEAGCETVEECIADEFADCQEEFADCKSECFRDKEDCDQDAAEDGVVTDEERFECRRDFDVCRAEFDLEACDTTRSDCVDQARSPETKQDCRDRLADCETNCNPVGFVADFRLRPGETVYLFKNDEVVDRIGVADPDVPEEFRDRFFDASIGRYPDGTGPYGVHYSGATPGTPNRPTDVEVPSISRPGLITRSPACGQDIEVTPFSVIADSSQLQDVDVLVEYADGCGEAGAEWSSEGVLLLFDRDEVLDSGVRVDINGDLVTVERTERHYRGAIVPGDCTVQRAVRVRAQASETLSVVQPVDCTFKPGQQELLPKIAINEYMPRNTSTLRFRYNPRELVDGTDPDAESIYERPDWIELVNYGNEPVDISDFGLVGLGRWRNYELGERENLNPWRLNDPRYTVADDDPTWNVEVKPETFTSFKLDPGCHLVILADDDAPRFRITYRPVSITGERPLPSDDAFPGDADCQLRDDEGAFFFSTNFGLSASERDDNDPDGFVLVYRESEDARWLNLDQAVIDFEQIDDPSVIVTDPVDGERRIKENVSFGRLGLGEESFGAPLGLGLPYAGGGTPGSTNTEITDLPPRFEDVVTIVPRNPRDMQAVEVRGRVDFDEELGMPGEDFAVELLYETGEGEVEVLGSGSGLTLTTEGIDQMLEARPGGTLWEFVATIPGQPDDTYVRFVLRAEDLKGRSQPSEVVHGEQDVPGVSFQYLVGYEPAVDAPKINEVLPANQSTPVPPFEGAAEQKFPDYAEIHNPSNETWDLSGYYLAQSELPPIGSVETPIQRSRQWRFPDETLVAPGDVLTVYFGSVPDGYLEVDFGLSCAETLYLIAPDEPELGANSIVDSVPWNFTAEDLPCEPDRSFSRLCGGTSEFEKSEPTPDRPNFDDLRPLEFHSAYHSDPIDQSRGQCLASGPLGVNLNAVVFMDADLVALLDPTGNERNAVLFEEQGIVVTFEDGSEDTERGGLDYCQPGLCEPAPEGQTGIHLNRNFNPSGRDEKVFRWWVEARDVCGNSIVAGPFTVFTCDADIFTRGDANRDGSINVTDALAIVGHLFLGAPLSCPDAGDVDDTGELNVTDAIVVLAYLFQGGEVPPLPPFPEPGIDPTPDELTCD